MFSVNLFLLLSVEITSVSANLGKSFYNFRYNRDLFEFQVNCDKFPTILVRIVYNRLYTFSMPFTVLGKLMKKDLKIGFLCASNRNEYLMSTNR